MFRKCVEQQRVPLYFSPVLFSKPDTDTVNMIANLQARFRYCYGNTKKQALGACSIANGLKNCFCGRPAKGVRMAPVFMHNSLGTFVKPLIKPSNI